MIVLGIDTATPQISVALVDDARGLLAERTDTVSNNRTGLLSLIDAVTADATLRPLDIDAVAVGAGPGSFTGLRIGMATAKGIAFALGRPLWAVSSLAALACEAEGVVVAVIDARKGEIYAGVYQRSANGVTLVGEERVMPPGELAAFTPPGAVVVGHGAPVPTFPSAVNVARLALVGPRENILVGGAPTYIRPSEAEVKYPDGVPGALRKRPLP